ncbi:MAG: Bacterial regulatory protein, Fis family, partial [Candidatus Methanoperedens nitroreducens]
ERTARNLSQAAQQLGISRSTLYRKLEQFGLKRQTQIDSV